MAGRDRRCSHLPAFRATMGLNDGRFGDLSPGVEVRPGKNGPIFALKAGLPGEPDPRAGLIAELEAQRRDRLGR